MTEYRYALVESDGLDIETQNAIIHQLELPCAALVYSGKKSLHAIVRVDAPDYAEYRRRVDYLYSVCQKNGLVLDQACRNPSRLSRMPGAMRGEQKQYLLETNFGKANWGEWKDWVESVTDDLPDTGDENSADQMAKFCNQFDLVCRELGCAVIYCHHHSKGAQGGKRSMDRASGSGVFARDPDAMLDMTELEPTEAIRTQMKNRAACAACCELLQL